MIIVTRPKPWAEPLCDKLKSAHIQYIYLPAARLEKTDYKPPNNLDGITLFLSQSGVLFAPDALGFEMVFAVGPKTAQAVENKYTCDCYQPRPGHYSVSGLLEDPFFIRQMETNSVLHIIGGIHSDVSRFDSLNAKVVMHRVYEMSPITQNVNGVPQQGEIWFTSQKLMQLFFDYYILTLNEKNLLSYDIVVPTMMCQEQAVNLGFKGRIEVVSDPRDESFIAHYQVKHRSK